MELFHKKLSEHFSPRRSVFCESRVGFFDLFKNQVEWEKAGKPDIWRLVDTGN